MEAGLFRSRFSNHFNHLTYLGMWSADMISHSIVKRLYLLYCMIPHAVLATAIVLQLTDLYFVMGNLRRLTFNFATSAIVVGYTLKIMLMYGRREALNELRLNLWQDSLKLHSEEDVAMQESAYSHLKLIRFMFYGTCLGVLPIMLFSSYFSYRWGPRELPFAAYLPMSDPLNDAIYVPALVFEGICAFYVICVVMEGELCMFSLIFQMDLYYRVLIRNLSKLNDIYADPEDDEDDAGYASHGEGRKRLGMDVRENAFKKQVDLYLRKETAKQLVKVTVIRHLKLMEYTKRFEFVFNRCMFVQTFAASLLIVMNGIELSLYLNEISIKLCFQTGFIAMIIADLLFICYHLSELSLQCNNVGNAAYSSSWYKMDPDMRRRLAIIIMRSRKPPKVTAAKFFDMDLKTFIHILSNIYSWLMLMRRLLTK